MASVIYKFSEDEFRDIVESSTTMTDILEKCGLRSIGSNRTTIQRRAKKENVPLTHLKSSQGKRPSQAFSLEQITVEKSTYKGSSLKKRLVILKVLVDQCAICGQKPEWNNKPLVLHLDHINGNHEDNRLENLRIVCPHCDSQLPTYKGRNKYHAPKPKCPCGALKNKTSKLCRLCENKSRLGKNTKIEWPPLDVLLEWLKTKPVTKVAFMLGVSDAAVKKHIRVRRSKEEHLAFNQDKL